MIAPVSGIMPADATGAGGGAASETNSTTRGAVSVTSGWSTHDLSVAAGTVGSVLVLLGASYRDVDLATVERLTTGVGSGEALQGLANQPDAPVLGAVVLATCGRLEIYLDVIRFHDGVDAVVDAVAKKSGIPSPEVATLFRVRVEADAACHLFRVAAGLESMVVGESQISGQVSDALALAQSNRHASSTLHLLFQSAAHTAKKVASDTDLHATGRTIAAAAIDLAEPQSGVSDPVLLIGTGAYARVVAAELRDRETADVSVFSPSGRQRIFAESRGLHPISHGELPRVLGDCRLVITCSGTGQTVLTPALVSSAIAERDMPLTIVDLALNPDVPGETRSLRNVNVIDLATVAANTVGASREAIDAAECLIDQGVAEFERLLADRQLSPAIVALRAHVTTTIQHEIDRLLPRIPAEAADEVRQSAHRITRALLHQPSVQARAVARTGDPVDYLRAVHLLFGIDVLSRPPQSQ